MAKLYVYGCSFSAGTLVNIKKPEHYQPFYQHQFKEYYWGSQVAKYLQLDLHERSIGGGAKDTTISRILQDSSLYSEGDKVIVGITRGNRYSLEPIRLNDFRSDLKQDSILKSITGTDTYSDINLGFMHEYFRQEDAGKIKEGEKEFLHTYLLSGTLEENNFTDDDVTLLMHWFRAWRGNLDKVYEVHHKEKFKQLQSLLYRIGVDVYVWEDGLWGEFQVITDWLTPRLKLKQRIKDSHWSPNGNTSFAAFVIEQIQQDVSYWNKNTVTRYKKLFNHNIISNLKQFVDSNFEIDTSWHDEKKYPWLKNRQDIY